MRRQTHLGCLGFLSKSGPTRRLNPQLLRVSEQISGGLSRVLWFVPIHAVGFYAAEYSQPGYNVVDFVSLVVAASGKYLTSLYCHDLVVVSPSSPHVRQRRVMNTFPMRPSVLQQECCLRVTWGHWCDVVDQ